jgi:multidrug efflux pump subunit AcrA (membrane-fusion protein)
MKAKVAIIAVIGLLALFANACGKRPQASAEKPPVVTGVKVEKVAVSAIDDFYEATGTVRSKTSTVLSSKIMGTVTSVRVREGDRVNAGQTVIEIDNRDAAAQLQKAQAGLRQAQEGVAEVEQSISAAQSARAAADANKRLTASTLTRYQSLLERKSVSPQEFDEVKARAQVAEAEADRADKMLQMLAARKKQAQAQIDQARADIASAQVQTGYSRIASPIRGIVTARHTEIGSQATPGAPLLMIEDASRYRLEAAVEESMIGSIKLRDKARVRIDAIGDRELEGTVAEILPAADPMSRSYTVKIDVPSQALLRSGMYGTARFVRGQKQAIAVPGKSIVQRGQLTSVFVVDGANIARLRLVKTGRSFGEQVEVLSGLSDGERIVTDSVAKVTDGSRLQ